MRVGGKPVISKAVERLRYMQVSWGARDHLRGCVERAFSPFNTLGQVS